MQMLIRKLKDCKRFAAGDGSLLRELLHPDKADIKLRYSLAHAVVKPGKATKPHALKTSEVYCILEGRGEMHVGAERKKVGPGCAVYIPPRTVQFIRNTGKSNLVFLCIVDPAWRKKDEIVF
jgi:mannose-6-phosphate isomerase-like protein (cupin superfamily)